MSDKDMHTVGVIGAGVMGVGIVQTFVSIGIAGRMIAMK